MSGERGGGGGRAGVATFSFHQEPPRAVPLLGRAGGGQPLVTSARRRPCCPRHSTVTHLVSQGWDSGKVAG